MENKRTHTDDDVNPPFKKKNIPTGAPRKRCGLTDSSAWNLTSEQKPKTASPAPPTTQHPSETERLPWPCWRTKNTRWSCRHSPEDQSVHSRGRLRSFCILRGSIRLQLLCYWKRMVYPTLQTEVQPLCMPDEGLYYMQRLKNRNPRTTTPTTLSPPFVQFMLQITEKIERSNQANALSSARFYTTFVDRNILAARSGLSCVFACPLHFTFEFSRCAHSANHTSSCRDPQGSICTSLLPSSLQGLIPTNPAFSGCELQVNEL